MDPAEKDRLIKMLNAAPGNGSGAANLTITITRNEFRASVIEAAADLVMRATQEKKIGYMDAIIAGMGVVATGTMIADILYKNAKDNPGGPKA